MSPTTRRLRETSFQVVSCDIPPDMTVADYRRAASERAERTDRAERRLALRGRRLRRAHRG